MMYKRNNNDNPVVGNWLVYHRPECHTIAHIPYRKRQHFNSWKEAVAEGMRPCQVCNPEYDSHFDPAVVGNWEVYHRPECHTIAHIPNRERQHISSWKEAVAEGMRPCQVCNPEYDSLLVSIVLGYQSKYHTPECNIIKYAPRKDITKYRLWADAVFDGLESCDLCRPPFFPTAIEEGFIIGTRLRYHMPNCPLLNYVNPIHIEKFCSLEEAGKRKMPCDFCCSYITKMKYQSNSTVKNEQTSKPIIFKGEDPPQPVKDTTITKTTADTSHKDSILDINELTEWRRYLAGLVDKLLKKLESSETDKQEEDRNISYNILRLSKAKCIPRHIAQYMRIITEMRNLAEYEGKTYSEIESDVGRTAWKAIQKWIEDADIDL